MGTAGFEPSNGDAPAASSSSAHGADNSGNRPPSDIRILQDAGDAGGPSWLVERRGSSTGARPLQGTERLEHGGDGARVVFGAQVVEYENGLDYAATLSNPAYFFGYTAIPLGNAPRSVCRRCWASGMLKGARASQGG